MAEPLAATSRYAIDVIEYRRKMFEDIVRRDLTGFPVNGGSAQILGILTSAALRVATLPLLFIDTPMWGSMKPCFTAKPELELEAQLGILDLFFVKIHGWFRADDKLTDLTFEFSPFPRPEHWI